MGKHFLDISDYSTTDIQSIIRLGSKLKKSLYGSKPLHQKSVGLLFEKPSLRTRVSFEAGIHQLGGQVITLKQDEVGLGKREVIEDVAQVLSRMVDMVVIRTFDHVTLKRFAAASQIPVINALTDTSHPCQAIADAMTIYEHMGTFNGVKVVYLGDDNNVSLSLARVCHAVGMTYVVSSPTIKNSFSEQTVIEPNPQNAVKGAHVLYTDTWVSMGSTVDTSHIAALEPYQLNQSLVSNAEPNAIVLHCLPAYREKEITSSIMDQFSSCIFDQAENRLHAQKAIMSWLIQR